MEQVFLYRFVQSEVEVFLGLDSKTCQAERSRSPTPVRTHSIQNCFYKNIRFNNIAANQDVGFDFAQPDKQRLIDFNIKRNIFLTFI